MSTFFHSFAQQPEQPGPDAVVADLQYQVALLQWRLDDIAAITDAALHRGGMVHPDVLLDVRLALMPTMLRPAVPVVPRAGRPAVRAQGVARGVDLPALPSVTGRDVLLRPAQPASVHRKAIASVTWVKFSDTAASHPVVLAPLAWEPEHLDGLDRHDLAGILFGLVGRCATRAAQYERDYEVADGVVVDLAGPHWRTRAEQAARAGYWTRNAAGDGWTLLEDEHLFHIRRKAEIEWERARKRDISNPRLIVPVRLRDGDGCRYCGNIVQWNARRGNRAGTYDHRKPGQQALFPEDLVVCCARCNSDRGANSDALSLRPAPATPHYGDLTVRLLAEHGHIVPSAASEVSAAGPGDASSDAPRPASDGASDGDSAAERVRDLQVGSADSADRRYPADRNPGRDGNAGRSGTARRGRRGGRRAQNRSS